VAWNMAHDSFGDFPSASTINGKLGDLFNCSGKKSLLYMLEYKFIDVCTKLTLFVFVKTLYIIILCTSDIHIALC
jgi:hypothetical protein